MMDYEGIDLIKGGKEQRLYIIQDLTSTSLLDCLIAFGTSIQHHGKEKDEPSHPRPRSNV